MKVFISHSSRDLELAKAFSYFLKTLYMEMDIYCTSLQGTINRWNTKWQDIVFLFCC